MRGRKKHAKHAPKHGGNRFKKKSKKHIRKKR